MSIGSHDVNRCRECQLDYSSNLDSTRLEFRHTNRWRTSRQSSPPRAIISRYEAPQGCHFIVHLFSCTRGSCTKRQAGTGTAIHGEDSEWREIRQCSYKRKSSSISILDDVVSVLPERRSECRQDPE